MESNFDEPICHAPASFTDDNTTHSSDDLFNSCNVEGEKSNKAIKCTDITEFESDDTDLLPDHNCLAEDEIPRVGMRFEHLKLAQDFYATYAKKVSFVSFCGYRVQAPTRKNTVATVGCTTRIYAKFDREKQDWVLLKVDYRHSHPCSTKKVVHYHENRELTMHTKCMIEVNDEASIRPNKIFLALANEEMLNYFMRMKEINPNFFDVVNVDNYYKFRSAVWVDARCRESYAYDRDVLDVNKCGCFYFKHGLPFASFVGVNHHEKSTLLGCALRGSEKIPSFKWVLTQWLKCMGTTPQEIITDHCRFIFGTIRKVLPNTRQCWCIWHITKKIPYKLDGYARFKELNAELNHIIWNPRSIEAFEDGWAEFIDEFNLHHNTCLSDLFEDRRMWVPIFFKGQFWATMRSTQRSESMHAFFGGYLYCKISLV
ncbi:protein FAR-RED IMPAIRED RESPONSE 1-like [Arachis hypogaea]|uniref:protein FAR-RED IMPAIRED RESPONSE 1-like n=1 Tax=Arachis hypogaea TaxID=3818 RepID=UPI000DEC8EAC|nr:protein FAR-RED IMPAIRED RESPONSE 1-like [Arachis hypogaea]